MVTWRALFLEKTSCVPLKRRRRIPIDRAGAKRVSGDAGIFGVDIDLAQGLISPIFYAYFDGAFMRHVQNTDVNWQSVSVSAPFSADLELAVLDSQGVHALVFPCRRILGGWIKSETNKPIEIHPTHWRKWAY